MDFPPRYERFQQFIEKLRAHQPAANRQDAVSLMKRLMKEVEDYHQLPSADFTKRMSVYPLNCGWRDLESDPCYWDDASTHKHRTFVYNSGRIVIKYVFQGADTLVLDKPGA